MSAAPFFLTFQQRVPLLLQPRIKMNVSAAATYKCRVFNVSAAAATSPFPQVAAATFLRGHVS